jgi:serine/threonine protein kinase
VGRSLGAYRIAHRIGEGGMGVVYLGVGSDGRAVAVKVLRPHVAGDPDMRRRLAREVATLQRIRHPRVAQVLDADLASSTPYLVTEYVPARQLDEVVRDHGALDAAALVRLGRGLGDALAAIHDVGVIHRDLKPANVLVLDGDPVLIDFGIAHIVDDVRLTMTGLVMGTPGYLSPELIEGGQVGRATDWWAWAATMIFAATGRPPFGRGPMEVVLDRVRREAADLDGVPAGLVPVLRAALSIDPAARPRPGALRRALDRVACEPSNDDSGEWISGPVQASASAVTTVVAAPSGVDGDVAGTHVVEPGTRVVEGPPQGSSDRTQVVAGPTQVVAGPTQVVAGPTQVVPPRRPIQPTRVIAAAPSTSVMPAVPPASPPSQISDSSRGSHSPPTPDASLPQRMSDQARPQPPWARSGPQPRPAGYQPPPVPQPTQQQRAPWAQPPSQAPWMNGPAGRPVGGPLPARPQSSPPPVQQLSPAAQPTQPSQPAPAQIPTQVPPRPRRTGTMLGCLITTLAAMVAFPILTLAVLALTSTLARTVNRTWWSVASRRLQRGRSGWDIPRAAACTPWYLLVSVLGAAFAALLPLLLGVCAYFAVGIQFPIGQSAFGRTLPLAAAALVIGLTSWWGPGGSRLRQGSRSIARGLAPGDFGAGVAVVVLIAVAAAGVGWSWHTGWVPNWAPLASSPLSELVDRAPYDLLNP